VGAVGGGGGEKAEIKDGAALAFHYGRKVDNAIDYLMSWRLGI